MQQVTNGSSADAGAPGLADDIAIADAAAKSPHLRTWLHAIFRRLTAAHRARQRAIVNRALKSGLGQSIDFQGRGLAMSTTLGALAFAAMMLAHVLAVVFVSHARAAAHSEDAQEPVRQAPIGDARTWNTWLFG
jgi:hypothetical protein